MNETNSSTYNSSADDDYYHELHPSLGEKITLEIFTITAIACIAANLLTSFVIVRYPRIREEKSNLLILHWSILNSIYMFSFPLIVRLQMYTTFYHTLDLVPCLVEDLQFTLMLVNMLILFYMSLYWYFQVYNPNLFIKLCRHFNFFVIIIYFVGLSMFSIHVYACSRNLRYMGLSVICMILAHLAFLVYMAILNIVHLIRKRRLTDYDKTRNIPFILVNVQTLSFLPLVLGALANGFFYSYWSFVIMMTGFFLYSIVPIYYFFVLFKFDNDFHTYFKHILTLKFKKYGVDELDNTSVSFTNNKVEA